MATGCWSKSCENCKNGAFIKETFLGNMIYMCSVSKKKVKYDPHGSHDCGSWACGCDRDEKGCGTCHYNK